MAQGSESYGYDQLEDKSVLTQRPEVVRDQLPPYQPHQPAPVGFMPQTVGSSTQQQTTVVMQQPAAQGFKEPRQWTSTKFACCDDMYICCCGTFCQHCLLGEVAQDLGEHCCVPCCVPGALIALRLKLRTQENIPGSLMDDCCSVAWCGPCTLCQLAREVKHVQTQRFTMAMAQPGTQY